MQNNALRILTFKLKCRKVLDEGSKFEKLYHDSRLPFRRVAATGDGSIRGNKKFSTCIEADTAP